MSLLHSAQVAAMACASVSAVAVARRRPQYRAVAALLVYDLASSMVREQVIYRILRPAKRALERQGLDSCVGALPKMVAWAGHVEHSLYLGWLAGIAALAIYVFLRDVPEDDPDEPSPLSGFLVWAILALVSRMARRPMEEPLSPRHPYRTPYHETVPSERFATFGTRGHLILVGIVWISACSVLVLAYPHLRCEAANAVYVPAEAAALLVSIGCAVQWMWRRRSPELEHLGAGLVIAMECMAAVVFTGNLLQLWPMARVAYVVFYSVLTLCQGGALWWWVGRSRA